MDPHNCLSDVRIFHAHGARFIGRDSEPLEQDIGDLARALAQNELDCAQRLPALSRGPYQSI